MNYKNLPCIFFVLIVSFFSIPAGAIHELPLQIDTPVKAAIFYFPQSSVLRCLNHSDVPNKFRKALIHRSIKIPNEETVEQNISIGVEYKKGVAKAFIIKSNIKNSSEIKVLTIDQKVAFGASKEKVKGSSFFGLENILGLQPKLIIMDFIEDQSLNYEIFLRTTKGKIGKENYKLDLFGQDKIIDGIITYVLEGKGKIGKDKITVIGGSRKKDNYEILEKYGPIEVLTFMKVYD